ncbi:hypothetical protein [Phocoenobacter skyensis]|uniref:hypothetical protein n=1 Tax=Phocoenobacter skyensis TaxID=97481 RepID=UPI002749092B|nr:hypothetical protein [Pasteurella skyensis]MDP8185337.1 hypothetical protein [Pasteurella skyensis]
MIKDLFNIIRGTLLLTFAIFFLGLIKVNFDLNKLDLLFLINFYPFNFLIVSTAFYLNKLNHYRMDTNRECIFQENKKKGRRK